MENIISVNVPEVDIKKSLSQGELLYRRQYVITTSNKPCLLDDWKQIKFNLANSLKVYHHPELIVSQIQLDHVELVLLGFMLDPVNPEYTNDDILAEIAQKTSEETFIESTFKYGGRYLLIRQPKGGKATILGDTIASRELYYTYQGEDFWAASQANLLKEFITLEERQDENYFNYVNSKLFIEKEKFFVGDESLYKNVFHLLPNHCITVGETKAKRYWPNYNYEPLKLNDAVQKASFYMKGLLKAAQTRFSLMIAFTAGWDSRMNVAASKEVKNDVLYYINRFPNLHSKSADIYIPKKLSKKLGLNFEVREHEQVEVPQEFMDAYHRNYDKPLNKFVKVYYHYYKNYPADAVNILTSGSEISRLYYENRSFATPEAVAQRAGFEDFEYVKEQSAKWLESVTESNYTTGDLFYWEQRVGNWASHATTQTDMVRESLSIYNCRDLMTTLLSVDPKYRGYNNKLYRNIMKVLWKDILSEPINPPESLIVTLKHYYRLMNMDKVINNSGLDKTIRKAYFKLKKATT